MTGDRPVGAVLCGGDSRRMGRDKALVEVGGVPMAELVARALADGGCVEPLLVGGDEDGLIAATGRPWVPDRWPGEGPLGGLITALSVAPGRPVVVSACDLPELDADTVGALIATAADTPVTVDCVVAATEHPHLVAWWHPGALTRVMALFEQGERGIRRAQRHLTVIEVPVAEHAMRNVNTPDDLPVPD